MRFLLWAVPVVTLAVGAYLAGAQLARLWATPLPQSTPLTPTAAPRVGVLVPSETVDGVLESEVIDVWQFYGYAGQFATLEMGVHPLHSSNPEARFGLDLVGPDGVVLVHQTVSVLLPPHVVEQELIASGTYHVRIVPLSDSLDRYSLRLILTDEARLTHRSAVTTTTTATSEAALEGRVYTVVEGDILGSIALAFDVTAQAIVDANDFLTLPDEIYPGMVLYIPPPLPTPTPLSGDYYVVQFGDTLWSLAWEFQCTIEDLIAANAGTLESPFDQLNVGQVLRVPEHSSLDEPLNCARVPERQEVITYVVRSGDTLLCLAHKFGISMATIQWANVNQLTDGPDLIYPGQTLTILPLDGVLHTVAEGETLESIAGQYQVEVADIVAWGPNRLELQSHVTAGQELVISNGTLPMYLWSPVQVERPGEEATPPSEVPGEEATPVPEVPGDEATPSPEVPGDQPTPSPVPDRPATPDSIAYVDPFYNISTYDTGYCSSPPPGWGWSGSLSWPTDSHDVHPQRGFRQGHPAIDIRAPLGSPVYAAGTGVVIWAGYNTWGYGNLVILNHGGGWLTLYAHLDDVSAMCGQIAHRGEMIGTIGQTGQSNFPHVHFEVRRNGYNFDPLNWLP